MVLNVNNETSLLKTVIIGRPEIGVKPKLEETYDAKSYNSIKENIYPLKKNVKIEMNSFERILFKYGIKVYKPTNLKFQNQVFARDIAFVIDDIIINPNIIKEREPEKNAFNEIFKKIPYDNIYKLPPKAFIEGGDVILYNDILFIGVSKNSDFSKTKTARTNYYALDYLKELFPNKTFIPLELKKCDYDPFKGILHLDCAFMPVSNNKAIVYPGAFKRKKDFQTILDVFGKENVFKITKNEAFNLHSNIFSISPNVIISDEGFVRLNKFLTEHWNIKVETISYSEIAKMGGLLRCSTIPLERINDYE